MFETFAPEVDAVKSLLASAAANRIWTLLDCDGKLYVCAGWHYVNRLGYFITDIPWPNQNLSVFVA